MKVEICAIGGYSEVGKNMTAIKVGNEVIICDMGFYLPEIIAYEEEGEVVRRDLTKEKLLNINAIPDDRVIKEWQPYVKAIVLGHCHLDHIGAVPYMAKDYKCPIIGTPYTLEVLKTILRDERINIPNKFKPLNVNARIKISDKISIEFINATHSTLQVVMIAIHTPAGTIVYANDYKFDKHPILGKKPNYARLKELGRSGNVIAVIMDALYSDAHMKTPSEKVAREMLNEVMLGTENRGHAVIVTTFASHIARLKSIIDFGLRMRRKIVMLGRSMHKYVSAAEKLNLVRFTKDVELIGRSKAAKRKLEAISKARDKYLIVCTGNQGEPNAMLTRITRNEMPFKFKPGDQVIFSSRIIPDPANMANRAMVEERLSRMGVRIFKDIHVSGHASREDHRDLITMLKPKHVIPAHGDVDKLTPLAKLATEMGYVLGKDVHIMRDGQLIELES